MPTRQIAKEQWEEFLSAFSAHNQTRPVNIELESTELGPQTLVQKRPFLGIEPDLEDETMPTLTVVAGDPEGERPMALTHEIMNPRNIWVKQDDQGRAEALDIETDDGRTIIQFAA